MVASFSRINFFRKGPSVGSLRDKIPRCVIRVRFYLLFALFLYLLLSLWLFLDPRKLSSCTTHKVQVSAERNCTKLRIESRCLWYDHCTWDWPDEYTGLFHCLASILFSSWALSVYRPFYKGTTDRSSYLRRFLSPRITSTNNIVRNLASLYASS